MAGRHHRSVQPCLLIDVHEGLPRHSPQVEHCPGQAIEAHAVNHALSRGPDKLHHSKSPQFEPEGNPPA